MKSEPRTKTTVLTFTALLATLISIHAASGAAADMLATPESFAAIADTAARSAALFTEAGKVLTHPRCMNCHCSIKAFCRTVSSVGMAFDGADRFAVKACRRHDARRAGVTAAVWIIDDHRAAQTLRRAAAEFGAGEAEIFAQIIVQRQLVADLRRAIAAAVDGHRYGRQHFDLEIAQRQVRAAGDDILPKRPFAVAGTVLIEWQRFQEGLTD